MNGAVTDGELYDRALTVCTRHGYAMSSMDWYETCGSMRIDYHVDFQTNSITLNVKGLPDSMPVEIFEDLLNNMFLTKMRGTNATVSRKTKNWLAEYKTKRVLA